MVCKIVERIYVDQSAQRIYISRIADRHRDHCLVDRDSLAALNKARNAADMAACASNLRQLGQACFEYQSENNGYFPPAWSWDLDKNGAGATSFAGPDLNVTRPPCLYGLLTALPIKSLVRCCPTVFNNMPHPVFTAANYGFFTYRYSGIVGGVDITNDPPQTGAAVPWPAVGQPVLGAPPTGYNQYADVFVAGSEVWWARPLKRVPYSSETILFGDYPQVETCATFTSNTPGDNSGFKNTGVSPGYGSGSTDCAGWLKAYQPLLVPNPQTHQKHQCIQDSAPVHNVMPATASKPITDGTQTWPAVSGLINVCYCDGSVHAITITQGFYNQVMRVDNTNDPTSYGAGYAMPGSVDAWDSSRFDPTIGP